ncbi:MAG: 30S ribosomal protein S20 [Phycisphaerales bacterium]
MAHSLSAQKRVRQNESAAARNRWRKVQMREAIKECLEKILHGSNDDAKKAYQSAARTIDRVAQKGVIHKNQAARRKSRLNARLKAKVLGAKK